MSDQNDEKFQRQVEAGEREHQKEIRVNEQRGWGDRRTWFTIGILAAAVFLSCVVTYLLVGTGIAGPFAWHLGTPGTAPG